MVATTTRMTMVAPTTILAMDTLATTVVVRVRVPKAKAETASKNRLLVDLSWRKAKESKEFV
jgi:hypothetical protein